jgi:hypothetical protein
MTVADIAAYGAGDDPIVDRIAVTHEAVRAFADEVVAKWFATPVKPMLVRATT